MHNILTMRYAPGDRPLDLPRPSSTPVVMTPDETATAQRTDRRIVGPENEEKAGE